jgi:hypothetical protein
MRLKEVAAGWRPPAELERSRPRELRLKPAGRVLVVFAVILGAGSLLAGVLLHVKASVDHDSRRRVIETGQDTEGRVVRKYQTRSGDDRQHWIEYEYRTDGEIQRARLRVGSRVWQALNVGTQLPVRYLASDPEQHLVPGYSGGLMPLWVPYLVAGGLALGACLVTLPLAAQRLLLAEGRPAPAIVTRHEKGKHGPIVHFVFQLLSGTTLEGKTGPWKKPPALDSVLCVLYLPDRARRNAVYPLSLVRAAHAPHDASLPEHKRRKSRVAQHARESAGRQGTLPSL